jgi:hypothetical protein
VQFFKSTLDTYRLKVYGCVKTPLVLRVKLRNDQGREREKGERERERRGKGVEEKRVV